MTSRCETIALPFPIASAPKKARIATAAANAAIRTELIDVSATTGKTINGPITAWTIGTAPDIVEHVAGAADNGHLLVFYRSRNSNGWRVVDASAEAGQTIVGDFFTSWITTDGEFTVEHVAASSPSGDLLVFYWSPRNSKWKVVNATAESGRKAVRGLTSWLSTTEAFTVEHVAAVGANGELTVFWWSPRAGRWQAVDASAEAGRTVAAHSLTSWVTHDGESTVEHVAATNAAGEVLVFYWSSTHGKWQVVDATKESGRKAVGGLTSWVTTSGKYTVEHVAGVDSSGQLNVFWWSPAAGHWQAVNATRIARGANAAGTPQALPRAATTTPEMVVSRSTVNGLLLHWWTSALDWQVIDLAEYAGTHVTGDPVAWTHPGADAPERVAVRSASGHLLVFQSSGAERQMVEELRQPAFSLPRMRKVRRKLLTILWDPHRPTAPRPSREAVEAAVLGAVDSVRDYYLENSDGLYTIESAGVYGWYDSDYPPSEYWPGGGKAGRDSGAEAIRKAVAQFDFAAFDADRDSDVEAKELGILFILPGTGDGGGLNRIVGEDYTTRQTAKGITVDGKKVTWIAEVSIGAPPGPGIVAHELAHLLLGHGDMYFAFFTPSAAGTYSLMDQDGRAPHLDPFAKLKLGWLHPRVLLRSGRYRLPAVETHYVAWVLPNLRAQTPEYFIVENRSPGTSYDKVLPDRGLAVWHVMENPATYDMAAPPPNVSAQQWATLGSGPNAWARKAIRMIRPIQTPPFDNSRALWDGSDSATGYDLLSADPNPVHATLRWADGTESGYALRDISAAGPEMEVSVEVPEPTAQRVVPSVRFTPRAVADQQVRNADLVPKFGGSAGTGTAWVFSQSPAAGAKVAPGATITMRLQTGPVP
ncbi:MAG: PASTA domain-containing protein [Betaproteobacteria bacterium]